MKDMYTIIDRVIVAGGVNTPSSILGVGRDMRPFVWLPLWEATEAELQAIRAQLRPVAWTEEEAAAIAAAWAAAPEGAEAVLPFAGKMDYFGEFPEVGIFSKVMAIRNRGMA